MHASLKMKKLLITLLATVSLLANSKVIELHGDSTQVGYAATYNPAVLLQMQIDKVCGAGLHTVVNKGWGGTTAHQALTALPVSGMYDGKTFAQYISTSPANIIIANWGINDNFVPNNTKWLFAYDHTQMAAIAKSYGKVYIAETSNPLFYQTQRDALIWEWAMTLIDVGAQSGYPVIDQWNGVNGGFPFWNWHLLDGIHPAQTLYFQKSMTTFKFLKDKGYLC
jgi:GDSL-like Lipase/Acylhydrolase family